MNHRDDNPYKPPECVPEIEVSLPKQPAKPPSRHVMVGLNGWNALGGTTFLLAIIVESFWPELVPTLSEKRRMLPQFVLISLPIAVLISWWTWRSPRSKWVLAAAYLPAISCVVMGVIGHFFFGLK